MFEFASKLLPALVYPLGLASFLIILSLFLTRREKLQRMLLILSVALLWLGGNRWVSYALARSLEQRYPRPGEIPNAEILVLLGGGTNAPEAPRELVEVNSAGDRVIYAAHLYREEMARQILVSGGLLDWESRRTTPAEDMADLLVWMGVPAEAILLQGESRNTYEDALYTSRILKEKGIDRILLVSSAWHMPRAVMLFEAQGLEVIPLPTDYNVTQMEWDQLWRGDWRSILLNLFPSASNLSLTTRMMKEYFGLWVYGLRGWMG